MSEKIRIVLVDDHAVLRAGLTALLNAEADMTVVGEAGDGAASLPVVADRQPDVVLLDINMPNMNGFDLLKNIRAEESLKNLPVLMVTAEAKKEDIVLAAQNGASGYIVKPFTKATLEEKLTKIIQKSQLAA